MVTNLRMEPKETYLEASLSGSFAMEEVKRATLLFLDSCARNHLTKILVDCRTLEGSLTFMQRWDYCTFLASQVVESVVSKRLLACQMAYVANPPLADPGRFGETVARNRGVNAKMLNDLDEAIRWLGVAPEVGATPDQA